MQGAQPLSASDSPTAEVGPPRRVTGSPHASPGAFLWEMTVGFSLPKHRNFLMRNIGAHGHTHDMPRVFAIRLGAQIETGHGPT